MQVVFDSPVFLWFLLVIPFLIIIHFLTLKYGKQEALKFSNFEAIARITKEHIADKPYPGFFFNKNIVILSLRVLSLFFLILAVSGMIVWYEGKSTDFDFVLAIDSSSSMLADDLSPNRLEATKVAASLFIENLNAKSRGGLVTFSGTSFIEQKLTGDFSLLKETITNVGASRSGGTDLATAIITSSTLMVEGDAGKVIILLTDGQSNVGMSVTEGIDYANRENVIIYTIGVGTSEGGKFLGSDILSKLDEDTLIMIADATKGKYFRAESKDKLIDAYNEISSLNIRKIPVPLSPAFMLIALAILVTEWILINTKYRIVS